MVFSKHWLPGQLGRLLPWQPRIKIVFFRLVDSATAAVALATGRIKTVFFRLVDSATAVVAMVTKKGYKRRTFRAFDSTLTHGLSR